LQRTLQLESERAMFSAFDPALIQDFFKEPYVTIPRRPQEWYVIAPRFVNFQIGWLEKSTARRRPAPRLAEARCDRPTGGTLAARRSDRWT
jgi:hypothetical protein